MNDSSAERAARLGQVRPRQIFCLLDILRSTSVRQRAFVSARFEEQAAHFSETLRLLEDLGWVRAEGDSLRLNGEGVGRMVAAPATQRGLVLAETLLDGLGPYEGMFTGYLSQFVSEEGELVYRPAGERRLRESPVRDFLMELGAVTHRTEHDCYILAEPFAFLRLWARNVRGPADQAELDRRGLERQELGRAAELEVLEWEKRRVGPASAERIRHVAALSPAACYDIQSVSLDGPAAGLRFIEVKAVAVDTYKFHWTAAEVEAAQILGARYFLYLLPVRGPDGFDLDNLAVIQNPFAVVYQNPALWSKQEAVVVFQKREPHPS